MAESSAVAMIEALGLVEHPEGGYYREVYRDGESTESGAVTSIYFLLEGGEQSRWHRVMGSAEVWCFHSGAPLSLYLGGTDAQPVLDLELKLGHDLAQNQQPQFVVKPDEWQKAESEGPWSLVSCVVAPAFSFERFQLL